MQAELAAREIESGRQDPRALRASFEQMANASERAAHMVNQLLSMARAEAQNPQQAFKPVDLDALACDVMRDFVPRALDKSIDLGYEGPSASSDPEGIPPDSALVNGHAVLLRELIANLVGNALHYTPSGGTVTLRVMPDPFGQVVALQVEDSGPGIPAAERALVFEPFYRALGTAVDGSGLGLAIVAEIARQHGSEVSLQDAREPGQIPPGEGPGALFTLRLARLQTAPEVVEGGGEVASSTAAAALSTVMAGKVPDA
jgi:two-component system sensor histidine kinase TctE